VALTRAAIGLIALAIFAPAAKANLYCVNTASCVGGMVETDFQQALNDAQVHAGSDSVQVGPGTFDSSFGFSYSGSDPVEIFGAGTGVTTVSDSGAADGTDALHITGSTASTVSGLTLVGYAGGYGSALDTVGSASDISATSPTIGNVTGITAGPATVLSHVTVSVPLGGGSATNEGVLTSPGTVVQDSTIQGREAVVDEGTGAAVTLRRLTISADFDGVEADGGANMSVQDALILNSGSSVGLDAIHSSAQIAAENVTLVGPGTPGSIAIAPGDTGSISFRNSIAVGYGHTFDTDASSSISTDYSDYAGTRNGTGTITEAHQLNVDPGFVNAASGNYRLATGSPLINAGDPAGPSVGASLTDLAGNPRVQFGRLDVGAYELQPIPPPPATKDTTAPVFSRVSETNKVFAVGKGRTPVSAKRKRVKVGTTFRFTLSEGASVKLAIAQRQPGRRVGKACRKPSRKNSKHKRCSRFVKKGTLTRTDKSGANSLHFTGRIGRRALKPGSYRVTITANDAAGNKSKPKTLSFRVVKKRR
jgi:hypothetical protein